jgi:hypothetical protein
MPVNKKIFTLFKDLETQQCFVSQIWIFTDWDKCRFFFESLNYFEFDVLIKTDRKKRENHCVITLPY